MFFKLQRQIIVGLNLAIYIVTTILVIFICIAGHRLSKINVYAAQSDKQTIQAHAFLRKDIIREKVKTHKGRE